MRALFRAASYILSGAMLAIVFLLASCTGSVNITMQDQQSGKLLLKGNIKKFAYSLQKNFDDFEFTKDDEGKTLSLDEIRASLQKNSSISQSSVSFDADTGDFLLSFNFSDLSKIVEGGAASKAKASSQASSTSSIFSLQDNKADGTQSVIITISQKTIEQILEQYHLTDNELVGVLSIGDNSDMSREEYINYLAYFFGSSPDKTTKNEIINSIKQATVNMTFTMPGPIVQQSGGKQLSSRKIVYQIPLLDLLQPLKTRRYVLLYHL